ncbi:hypothetical protein V501_06320 [Pseudogymnoascus sp. VKM F-4519 (FW-2642)]|nr:hypothetical protein V501_06320 [Pseudogymnoascus sp. VKM F-4519 (FW-2642)]
MHTITLLAVALTASIAAATVPSSITHALRAQPTFSEDPWQCVTENLTQYLDVPKPTGLLFSALHSYASDLYEPCLAAMSTATSLDYCSFPPQSEWCAFTTAAPKDVLTAYSSYASQAYSWWSARSSTIAFLKEDCPNNWDLSLWRVPGGEEWLNDTIAFAGCYAEALTATGPAPTGLAAGGAATTKTTATSREGAAVGSATPTATDVPNGAGWVGVDMWMVAMAGFAAVVV